MIPLLSLLACGTSPPEAGAPAPEVPAAAAAELTPLDTAPLLRRISLDVRGLAPTLAEYRSALADPTVLDALVEEWLHDPRFADRVVELYSEIYLTRTQDFPFSAYDFNRDDQAQFERSVGEEPLRVLAHVADQDLPYTELVTGDWTMADQTLSEIFPIDRPDGDGWQVSHYTDGRPSAGVLSTTGLWWRYTSTDSNFNRKRANQTSRILLCTDYLTRPIDFDRNVNLLEEGAVEDALTANPSCANCHVSLDPLASYFYGFWWLNEGSAIEASLYHPARERLWQDMTAVAPAYYGQPGNSLSDLGEAIAADNRFVECAVEQAFELLTRRDVTLEDADALTGHRNAFIEGGLTMRELFRTVLADPVYRSANTEHPRASALRLASPDMLASQVEGLTGYRWTFIDYDMMASDSLGVRTLAGGADGYSVTEVSDLPNATSVLVQQRLAEGSVTYLMSTDPDRLLAGADLSAAPANDLIVDLYLAVLGEVVEPQGAEVEALSDLWSDLNAATGDPEAAWSGIVYALLRDPQFVLY